MSANVEGTGTPTQQTSEQGGGTPPPTQQTGGGDDLTPQQMMQAIQALPEQVANAIKEQLPQPTTQTTNEGGNSDGEGTQQTPGETPKRNSFQEFWFGNG